MEAPFRPQNPTAQTLPTLPKRKATSATSFQRPGLGKLRTHHENTRKHSAGLHHHQYVMSSGCITATASTRRGLCFCRQAVSTAVHTTSVQVGNTFFSREVHELSRDISGRLSRSTTEPLLPLHSHNSRCTTPLHFQRHCWSVGQLP